MAKKKYYVVWQGLTPGIYEDWASAQTQIKGFPGAKYKSFPSRDEATDAFISGYSYSKPKSKSSAKGFKDLAKFPEIIKDSISVDAACSGNPGKMEYQGVETFTKKLLFRIGPLEGGTNNIGEFLALIHALAIFQKKGNSTTTIYTDSRTGMAWLRNKKVKTTLKRTVNNKKVFDLLERAIQWMMNNNHRNPVVKWDTAKWGEIPADFERK